VCWIASLAGIVVRHGRDAARLLLRQIPHRVGEMAAVVRAGREVQQVLRQDTSPHCASAEGVGRALWSVVVVRVVGRLGPSGVVEAVGEQIVGGEDHVRVVAEDVVGYRVEDLQMGVT
jgi:ribosomal protein S28E/S33